MSQDLKPFGKLKSLLWPIHDFEMKKILFIFFIFFFISFNYNLLTCLRITLLVSTPECGASSVPFVTIFMTLPSAFLLTKLFSWLNTKFSRNKIFYIFILGFLAFYAVFIFVLYPNLNSLTLDSVADFIVNTHLLPAGYKNVVGIIRYWPISLFFTLSELWGTIVFSVLFWGFCNEVTSMEQAKRSYAIFSLGANSAGFFSGHFANFIKVDKYISAINYGSSPWEQTLLLQFITILCVGVVIVALFAWLNCKVLPPNIANNFIKMTSKISRKRDSSIRKSLRYVFKSRYAAAIAIIVIAYNVVYNLSYVLWTEEVKNNFSSESEINVYMNQITAITSILAFLFALLLSGNLIRKSGWTIAAMVTPVVCFVTSIGFLSSFIFEEMNYPLFMHSFLGLSVPLFFASAQFSLGRACKYTLFDETKEIAFIPLTYQQQRKVKTVVDGLASLFGKSGGSMIYLLLLAILGSLKASAPYVALSILTLIVAWIFAVILLGKLIEIKSNKANIVET